MAFQSGIDDGHLDRPAPVTRVGGAHDEERRARSGRLGIGTLACNRCDAPVAIADALAPSDAISCPYCRHRAAVRDFLSLAAPTRPARVEVRIRQLA